VESSGNKRERYGVRECGVSVSSVVFRNGSFVWCDGPLLGIERMHVMFSVYVLGNNEMCKEGIREQGLIVVIL
jgi:hypothetical protein